MTKQFDPSWPFPQFDENGVQLLPSDFLFREMRKDDELVVKDWPWDIEEAPF